MSSTSKNKMHINGRFNKSAGHGDREKKINVNIYEASKIELHVKIILKGLNQVQR